eukprot:CAMPEP_0184495264 /NCGR_PEP_ID=MMETSP0113_2-20130426/30817_1 /TAXON_ID=91329 /ORGANISM="Norrisiella sphaerica, Strain BC52" /LENGTH=151 /DNA_ID=CAMNT_0026881377 /DNA_START=95 /DNA_END=550 /DNA_ORIENTATION=-
MMDEEDREEIKQVFQFIDEDVNGKTDGAIDHKTLGTYLNMDFGPDHRPLNIETQELEKFYESIVGNNTEYLRASHFVKAVLIARSLDSEATIGDGDDPKSGERKRSLPKPDKPDKDGGQLDAEGAREIADNSVEKEREEIAQDQVSSSEQQ